MLELMEKVQKAEEVARLSEQEQRKLSKQLAEQIMQVEYETKLRLKFETKLNYLYSLNRSFNENAVSKQINIEELDLDIKVMKDELNTS